MDEDLIAGYRVMYDVMIPDLDYYLRQIDVNTLFKNGSFFNDILAHKADCIRSRFSISNSALKPNLRPYIALQQRRTWVVKGLKSQVKSRLDQDFKHFNGQVQPC